jgi:hypothetical protein
MEVSGQLQAPDRFTPGTPKVGWAPETVRMLWSRENYLAPAGNVNPVVPTVARCYTDWAIPAPNYINDHDILVYVYMHRTYETICVRVFMIFETINKLLRYCK